MIEQCPPLMGVGGGGWSGNRWPVYFVFLRFGGGRGTVARHVLSERHSERNHFSASCLRRRLCLLRV